MAVMDRVLIRSFMRVCARLRRDINSVHFELPRMFTLPRTPCVLSGSAMKSEPECKKISSASPTANPTTAQTAGKTPMKRTKPLIIRQHPVNVPLKKVKLQKPSTSLTILPDPPRVPSPKFKMPPKPFNEGIQIQNTNNEFTLKGGYILPPNVLGKFFKLNPSLPSLPVQGPQTTSLNSGVKSIQFSPPNSSADQDQFQEQAYSETNEIILSTDVNNVENDEDVLNETNDDGNLTDNPADETSNFDQANVVVSNQPQDSEIQLIETSGEDNDGVAIEPSSQGMYTSDTSNIITVDELPDDWHPCCKFVYESVQRNLLEVKHTNTRLDSCETKLDYIIEIMSNRQNGEVAAPLAAPNILPVFPIESVIQFQQFDKDLKEKPEMVRQFENLLKKTGGKGIDKVIRNILNRVLSNAIGEAYTWTGQRKRSLKMNGTAFCNVITRVYSDKYSKAEVTVDDVEGHISEWLRRTSDRVAAEKNKFNKLKSVTEAPHNDDQQSHEE